MDKKLPIYKMLLDDNVVGMYTISLVDDPAVEVMWQAFDKQEEPLKFKIQDEDEHKILGVVCRADFPIYRRDKDGREYYIVFTPDVIYQMAQKFLKNGFQDAVNLEHLENTYVQGVELTQIFIKNTDKGINPSGFEYVENGSLFAEYKVENDAVWEAIKNGTFKGFSLEGFFDYERMIEKNDTLDSIEDLLNYLK